MRLLVSLSLLFVTVAAATAQDAPIPRLGDHVFVPTMSITEPFITSHVQTSVSLGKALNASVPVFDVTDSTILGSAQADLLFVGVGFKYQHAVKDWLAARVQFETAGRVGTSTHTLVAEGVTAELGYHLGWILEAYEKENFLLSWSVNLGNRSGTFINLLDWVGGILEGAEIPLVRARQSLLGTAGVHAAWGISPRFGLLGSFALTYGETFSGIGDNRLGSDGRMALSYDMSHDLKVPLGLALTTGYLDGDELAFSDKDLWFWSARLALQSRQDYSIGLDLVSLYFKSARYGNDQGVSQVKIDMRYYY